jgi:hypothetical protein
MVIKFPKKQTTLVINAKKFTSVSAWHELLDLDAASAPAAFVYANPTIGAQNPELPNPITAGCKCGIYHLNYEFPTHVAQADFGTLILPEVDEVTIGAEAYYVNLPMGLAVAVRTAMKRDPKLVIGIGAKNAID